MGCSKAIRRSPQVRQKHKSNKNNVILKIVFFKRILNLFSNSKEPEMEASVFAASYGKVIKVMSDQLSFYLKKQHMGQDGKFDVADIPAVIGSLVPLFLSFSDVKALIDHKELFLSPEAAPLLQAEFEKNFDLPDAPAEIIAEEVHNIIFCAIKVVVKIQSLKQAQPEPAV